MPVFVVPAAAAAYHYYKRRSSLQEDENETKPSSTKGEGSSDGVIPNDVEPPKRQSLLQNWNEKYGTSARNAATGEPVKQLHVRGEYDADSSTTCIRPTSTSSNTGDSRSSTTPVNGEGDNNRIGTDANVNNSSLLQNWKKRYPHLAEKKKMEITRRRLGDGRLIRSFINSNSSAGLSEKLQRPQRWRPVGTATSATARADVVSTNAEKGNNMQQGGAMYAEVADAMSILYASSSTRACRPISGMYAEVADTLFGNTIIIRNDGPG
jgi:hypothetical protein